MVTCRASYWCAYIRGRISKQAPCSVSLEGREAMTLQKQRTHLVPRCCLLVTLSKRRNQGSSGKRLTVGGRLGSTGGAWSILQCWEGRKCLKTKPNQKAHSRLKYVRKCLRTKPNRKTHNRLKYVRKRLRTKPNRKTHNRLKYVNRIKRSVQREPNGHSWNNSREQNRNVALEHFPGGPGTKTPHSECRGLGSTPGLETRSPMLHLRPGTAK